MSAMMVDTALPRPVIKPMQLGNEDGIEYCSGIWRSDDGKIKCGFASFRGRRASMEDCYDVKLSNMDGQNVFLFGVFDGHGGSRASEYLKEHLFDNLLKHPEIVGNTKLAISETFNQTDSSFLNAEREAFRDDGSTASTAILVGNHLYVANVGDSRTVMSKSGKAIALSEDHKPNRRDERKRIENAGGVVMWAGTWRVGGVLAMSRAFGNRLLKQFVVADPDIQDLEIGEDTELLVLASDGLWDVIPNDDAISIALSEEDSEAAAKKLTETAFSRGSCDNITCIVVRFPRDKLDQSTYEATSVEKSDSLKTVSVNELSSCSQTTTSEQSAVMGVASLQISETEAEQTVSSDQSATSYVSNPGITGLHAARPEQETTSTQQ